MIKCKRCESTDIIKNGFVRHTQRYKCKACTLNFVVGDKRTNHTVAIKKALCVILYSLGKASFRMLGKLLGVSHTLTYRWIVQAMEKVREPIVSGDIKEMEFDEMWRFVGSKKIKNGSSKRWIVAAGELLPGLSAIVMLQPLENFITKSNT